MKFDGSRGLVRGMAAGLAALSIAGLGVAVAVSGCNAHTEASGVPDAQTVCPATPQDAIGASCGEEGLTCYPQYSCGISQAIMKCVCTGGSFQCADVTGALLDAGDMPSCPVSRDAAGICPASEAVANLAPCGAEQQGQQCAYPAMCDGGVPAYDTCYCFTGQTQSGSMGLRWECSNSCNAVGAPPHGDAGPVPDAAMQPADAEPDAPAPRDAATD